jgi:hypothetical protein
MSMDKNSAEGKVCTFCNKDALPGTDPAVCSDHLMQTKEASEEEKKPETLKELEAQD